MGNTILQKDMISNGIPVYSATISDKILGYVSHCKYLLYKKDIVIPARGNSIGNATIIKDEKATCTQTTIGCKLSTFLNHEFIFYCCYAYKKSWFSYMGSAIPQITINNTYKNLIAIPPFKEQNRIVKKIEEIFPHIEEYNKKYTKLEKLNNNYKNELKKSILQYAIQGKLVKQNTNDEPAQKLIEHILDEKRKLMKEKKIKKENLSIIYKDSSDNQFYEKFEDNSSKIIQSNYLYDIPDNWSWTRLGNILLQLTDGTHKTPKYTKTGIPFVSVKDMSSGKLNFSTTKYISKEEHEVLSKRCNPQKGDILLSKVGTTGIPAIVDTDFEFSLFVSLALLKFDDKLIDRKYLIYLILSPLVQEQCRENTKGVGNKNWVIKDIANTFIVIPPLEEQQRIVSKIDKLFNLL